MKIHVVTPETGKVVYKKSVIYKYRYGISGGGGWGRRFSVVRFFSGISCLVEIKLRVELLSALWADPMTKLGFRMTLYIGFYLIPVSFVVSNFFT